MARSAIFDHQTISIPCPKCGKKHEKTIGWIKTNDKIACTCGVTIKLKRDDLVQGVDQAQKALDQIPRKITFKL